MGTTVCDCIIQHPLHDDGYHSHTSYIALQGGVIIVSHDEHLIDMSCNAVWLCKDRQVYRLEGGLEQYKKAIESELKST